MSLAFAGPKAAVWVCYPDEMNADTLGMAICPRCSTLTYDPHDDWCDLPDEWREEQLERTRAEAGRPDSSHHEVAIMLRDRSDIVSFADPSRLYGDWFGEDEDPIAGWTWDEGQDL